MAYKPTAKKGKVVNSADVAGEIRQAMREMFAEAAGKGQSAKNWAGGVSLDEQMEALNWRGDAAIPPGSPVHDILEAFKMHTDLPLDLSFHSFLFFLSNYLLSEGVTVKVGGQVVTPELWTVVLAPSGSGKSYSLSRIATHAPISARATIEGFASGAKLIEMMRDNEEAGKPQAWLEDEFGQKLKSLEQDGSPLFDAKAYLLKAYDGGPISRATKAETIEVSRSNLSIMGLNVDETFLKILTAESLLDGFAQRFAYVLAERDPERHFADYPIYSNDEIEKVTGSAWARIMSVPLHSQYEYSPEALDAYKRHFTTMGRIIDAGKGLDVSFFRRLMQRSHRLALAYHIILGDASDKITVVDVEWAMRLTRLHIADAARLIAKKSPDANAALTKAMALEKKLTDSGKKVTPSAVRAGLHAARDDQAMAENIVATLKNMRQ